jgi:hypothetical protein
MTMGNTSSWRGTIGRDGGLLVHDAEPEMPLVLRVGKIVDRYPVELTGTLSNEHWRGHVSADRSEFRLHCALGFTLLGRLVRAGTAYEIQDVRMIPPPSCLLPGETS